MKNRYPNSNWIAYVASLLLLTSGAVRIYAQARSSVPSAERVREIDDPHTGARWLLVPNPSHPERPGMLVQIVDGEARLAAEFEGRRADSVLAGLPVRPIIRPGDPIVVFESSAHVDASLEAVALGSAASGSEFQARLRIGRNIVRVRALGAGRALFISDLVSATGRQP